MEEAPKRIFLQDAGNYAGASKDEVTWCADPQDDDDTAYIRADLFPQWQPIETAPKDGQFILARWVNKVSGEFDHGVVCFERGSWVEYISEVSEPSFWMHIP